MTQLRQILDAVSAALWGPWLLIPLLLGTGLFLAIRLGGIQVRLFTTAMSLAFGRRRKATGDRGEISSYQAMATALVATVGTGNIVGVATAIWIGGLAAGLPAVRAVAAVAGGPHRLAEVPQREGGAADQARPDQRGAPGHARQRLQRAGGVRALLLVPGGHAQGQQADQQVQHAVGHEAHVRGALQPGVVGGLLGRLGGAPGPGAQRAAVRAVPPRVVPV
ncbi:sodium:alanine symporter family protein [Micrococcus luteus]|nr:sodium:alanine symporter family protein [Micrococcus luteus]